MIWIYALLSVATDVAISVGKKMIEEPIDIWKSVLLLPFIFVGYILLHLIAFCVFSLTADKRPVSNIHNPYRSFMISSLKLFLKFGRVHVHVEGEELVPDDGKFLFVSNHISVYDPIVTITFLAKKNLAFVSKKENLDVKFAGKYIAKSGCVPIDRENNREAVRAINKAASNITDGVCAMGIYPEGYVNKNVGKLLDFRNGAFKIALKAKVPIVVAVMKNSREANENLFKKRSDIYLKILTVIPYEEIDGLKTAEIGSKVYKRMEKEIQKED